MRETITIEDTLKFLTIVEEQYHPNGNASYKKFSNGNEYWFDINGRVIHCILHTEKFEAFWEYDERGNEIAYRNSDGTSSRTEFDENNQRIYRNYNGFETWYENGFIIHQKVRGHETWYVCDENGNVIHEFKNSDEEAFAVI